MVVWRYLNGFQSPATVLTGTSGFFAIDVQYLPLHFADYFPSGLPVGHQYPIMVCRPNLSSAELMYVTGWTNTGAPGGTNLRWVVQRAREFSSSFTRLPGDLVFLEQTGGSIQALRDWNNLENKPSTFPSSWSTLSGIPSTFPPTPQTLDWLSDVNTAGGVAGNALILGGGGIWVPGTIASRYQDLTDVDWTTPPTNGQVPFWNAGLSKWKFVSIAGGGGGASVLDDLLDVDTTTSPPTAGQALVYDLSLGQWVPGSVASSGGGGGSVRKIREITVGAGGLLELNFTLLPETGSSLRLELSGRTDGPGEHSSLQLQFNADVAAHFDHVFQYGTVNNFSGATGLKAGTSMKIGEIPAGSSTPLFASFIRSEIGNFRGTTFFKNVITHSSSIRSSGADDQDADLSMSGQWRNLAGVTSIRLFLDDGSHFLQGTVATLYLVGAESGPVDNFVQVFDDFNRANSATVGDPVIGKRPVYYKTGGFGDWGITGNQLAPKSNQQENVVLWDTGGPDYTLEATISVLPGDGGVIFRADSLPTWLLVDFPAGSPHYVLYQYLRGLGGGYNPLLTGTGPAPANGDVLTVINTAARMIVKVNGVVELDYSYGLFGGAALAGFRDHDSTAMRVDNLTITRQGATILGAGGGGPLLEAFPSADVITAGPGTWSLVCSLALDAGVWDVETHAMAAAANTGTTWIALADGVSKTYIEQLHSAPSGYVHSFSVRARIDLVASTTVGVYAMHDTGACTIYQNHATHPFGAVNVPVTVLHAVKTT